MHSEREPVLTKRRWSLKWAALYGLITTAVVFVVQYLADGGADLRLWLNAGPSEYVPYLLGSCLPGPFIFVTIAVVLNLFIRVRHRQ